MEAKEQIERLAMFILENIKHEPSEPGGAVECAIRLLKEHPKYEVGVNCSPLSKSVKTLLGERKEKQ